MDSISIKDRKVDEVMNVIEKVCSYDLSQVPESMRPGVQDVLLYTLNQYVKKIWEEEEEEYESITTMTPPTNAKMNDAPLSETTMTTTPFYVGETFSISDFLFGATTGECIHLKSGFRDRVAREMSRLYLLEKDAPVVKQKRNVICSQYRYPVAYKHLAMAAYDTVVNDMAREELTSFSEKK
jgi:hypothetical protein